MRTGQTSAISFLSQIATSAIGFFATILFARILGAEVLGTYFLAISIIHFTKIGGNLGLRAAIKKRISEEGKSAGYFWGGIGIQLAIITIISLMISLARDQLNEYIGAPIAYFVLFMLFADLFYSFFTAVLDGQRLVHLSSALDPIQRTLRSLLQIAAVVFGFGLVGLLYGYVIAGVLAGSIGMYFVSVRLEMPSWDDVRSLLDFMRYSWLSGIKGSVFSWMDVLVLGFFVSNNLIGVYEISWKIAGFLIVFSSAVSRAVFPEISQHSSRDEDQEVVSLANDALLFAGVFAIPGLVGSLVVGTGVLSVYGREFTIGYHILVLLIFARLIDSYQAQLKNILNAVNRPEFAFRVNLIVLVSNVVLNIMLIYLYGWTGAAVATVISAALGLILAFYLIRRAIAIEFPIIEVSKQWFAAVLMGVLVYQLSGVMRQDLVGILLPIAVGAGVYFLVLLTISERIRTTVYRNLPEFESTI